MQVRKVIQYLLKVNNVKYQSLTYDEQLQAVLPYIYNFNFPIFDENYRNILETSILKHYYFKGIGFETIGEWQFRLEEFLQRRMRYYNELYRSARIEEFDPREEVKLHENYSHNINTKRDTLQQQTADSAENNVTHEAVSSTGQNASDENSKGSQTGSLKDNKSGTSDSTTDSTSNTTTSQDTNYTGNEKQTAHQENLGNKQTIGEDTPQENIEINDIHASNISRTNENGTQDSNSQTDTTSDTKVTGTSDMTGHSETKGTTSSEDNQSTIQDTAGESHATNSSNATDKTNTVNDSRAKQNSSGSGNEKITTLDNYLLNKIGRNGNHTLASLIDEQRKMFLDVNTKLLDEMNILFDLNYEY